MREDFYILSIVLIMSPIKHNWTDLWGPALFSVRIIGTRQRQRKLRLPDLKSWAPIPLTLLFLLLFILRDCSESLLAIKDQKMLWN